MSATSTKILTLKEKIAELRKQDPDPGFQRALDELQLWQQKVGPVMAASHYCEQFRIWQKAFLDGLEGDKRHDAYAGAFSTVRLAIEKSCLLDRLIYGGENLRTKKCPIHQGHWSGCVPNPCAHCAHGICQTGWIKNQDDPESHTTGIMIVQCVEVSPPSKEVS